MSSFNHLTVEFLKTTLHPYTISRYFFEESPSRAAATAIHRGIPFFPPRAWKRVARKKGLFIPWAALIAAIGRTLDQDGEPFEE